MGSVKGKVVVSDIHDRTRVEAEALFDTGADLSVVSRSTAKKARLTVTDKVFQLTLGNKSTADYNPAFGFIRVKECRMPLVAGVLVRGEPAADFIVGLTQMELMGITLDPKTRSYSISCRNPRA